LSFYNQTTIDTFWQLCEISASLPNEIKIITSPLAVGFTIPVEIDDIIDIMPIKEQYNVCKIAQLLDNVYIVDIICAKIALS
jgi:hypothetical protein